MNLQSDDNSMQTTAHLEVDDDCENEDGGHQVHQVGQVLAVEGLAQTTHLILSHREKVEEGDHRSLKLRSCRSQVTTHTRLTLDSHSTQSAICF